MPESEVVRAGRRTQAGRTAATRELLLDTALDLLAEVGYARTTTQLICARAGLSRGAPQHHFATHEGLLAAAVDRLHHRMTDTYDRVLADVPAGEDRTVDALNLLWSLFTGALFATSLELQVAARTNPELASVIAPVEATLDRVTMRLCGDLFPDLAGRPDFRMVVAHVIATIRGLALVDVLQPRGSSHELWPGIRGELARLVDADAAR